MAVRFQLRRDTAANWTAANPTLALGEPGVETDTLKVKVGDGATAWNSLAYSITKDFTDLISKPTTVSGYGITDALTLTALSVTQNAANGTGALTYNNTTGVFEYTPPNFEDLDGNFTGSVFADDSTLLVDAVEGKLVGLYDNGVVSINNTNVTTYDLFVQQDLNTLDLYVNNNIYDGTTGSINKTIYDTSSGKIVAPVETDSIVTSTIDSTDSSAITITPDLVLSAGLTVGNHIIPSSNSNIDLGSEANRFRDLYLSGNSAIIGDLALKRHISGGLLVSDHSTGDPTNITTHNITANDITAAGIITGNLTGNVTGNVTGNITGNVTGDITGDITGNIFTSLIDSADSSAITFTPAVVMNSDLTVENSLTANNIRTTGNMQVDGDLTVSGTTVTIDATNLAVEDNMIYLNAGNAVANPDLGIAGNYNDGTYAHAGLFRDATDGVWKFYDSYTPEPDASAYIDTSHGSFSQAPVELSKLQIDSATPQTIFYVSGTEKGYSRINSDVLEHNGTAGVMLRHNAFEKLSTTTNGIDVTGVVSNFKSASYNILNLQTDTDDNGSSDDGIFKITNGSAGTTKAEFRWDESEDLVHVSYGDHGRHISINSSGNVGVGTGSSSPVYPFSVVTDVDSFVMKVENDGNSPGTSGASYADASDGLWVDTRWNTATNTPFKVTSNSGTSPMMIIKGDGKVGIGTTGPEVKFEVNGGADESVVFSARSDGGNGNNRRFNLIAYADGGGANYGGGLKIQTRDSVNVFHDRITVQSNGYVGVGTTSPNRDLEIKNDAPTQNTGIKIHNNSASHAAIIELEAGRTSDTQDVSQILTANLGNNITNIRTQRKGADGGEIAFWTSASGSGDALTQRMVIDEDGKVGIGITGPSASFDVQFARTDTDPLIAQFRNTSGANDARVMIATNANQSGDPYLKFDAGGTNFITGLFWQGSTDNELKLGAGERPSDGNFKGITINGNGFVTTKNTNYHEGVIVKEGSTGSFTFTSNELNGGSGDNECYFIFVSVYRPTNDVANDVATLVLHGIMPRGSNSIFNTISSMTGSGISSISATNSGNSLVVSTDSGTNFRCAAKVIAMGGMT